MDNNEIVYYKLEMKTLCYSIIVLLTAGLLCTTNSVYAPCLVGVTDCGPPPGVTVSAGTDSQFYEKNDTINVQGQVYVQNYSKPIQVHVVNPDNATVQSIDTPVTNGKFGLKIGANFETSGVYQIITCVKSWCDRLYFKFIAEPYKLTVNGQDYFIRYKSFADLENIEADTGANALRVHITNASGQFVIEIPRALMDSTEYGKDTSFKVLIGMHQPDKYMQPANFTEIANNDLFRTLAINIPYEPVPNAQGVWDFKISPVETTSGPAVFSEPPLKQFRSGVISDNISCKEGLYLAIKSHNLEPTCLKAGTISKLASRGFLYGINANKTNYATILIPPGSENPSANKTYSPDVATVVLGVNNTVRWVSQSETANTIVPDMPLIQNGKSFGSYYVIKPGGSYQFTFTELGTFAYHTEPHPWMKGKIIVLPQSNNADMFAAETFNLKQVRYYDSSNLHPQVSLYDYSYDGIEKDGLVSINNQTFYQTTLDNDIYKLKGLSVQFHNVTFSFPEGTLTTPGGAFVNLDVKFQDGSEEIYGGTVSNPDGSGTIIGGIPIPATTGPHLATQSITVLGNHTVPQAGLTIYHDKIKLLASVYSRASQEDSASVLKLLLSTDSDVIKPGQSIGITISVNNTLATPVDVFSQNNWSYQNVSTGLCYTIGYGVSIMDGFYDASNVTKGKSLSLFNPGALCPIIQETAKVYEFRPHSGDVNQVQCKPIEGLQCRTETYQMGQDYKFNGYWDHGIVQPFKSGMYTLVGADEWSHMEIRHFIVTNSTIFAGDLGAMSCPTPLGFSAHVANLTGFTNLFSQRGTYFILHPGMQGTINVQYDTPSNSSWFQNDVNAPFNLTNGAALLYMANVTSYHITTPFAVSLYDDDNGHHSQICHYNGGMFSEPCNYNNKGDIPPNEIPAASEVLHPGIDTSYTPKYVMVYPNGRSGFTVTISADSNAKEGVYWLSMGRSLCGPGILAKLVVLP